MDGKGKKECSSLLFIANIANLQVNSELIEHLKLALLSSKNA